MGVSSESPAEAINPVSKASWHTKPCFMYCLEKGFLMNQLAAKEKFYAVNK
jgi:hypothetical protein